MHTWTNEQKQKLKDLTKMKEDGVIDASLYQAAGLEILTAGATGAPPTAETRLPVEAAAAGGGERAPSTSVSGYGVEQTAARRVSTSSAGDGEEYEFESRPTSGAKSAGARGSPTAGECVPHTRVHAYTYTRVRMHTRTHAYTHTSADTHRHKYAPAYRCTSTHRRVHAHASTHTPTNIHTQTHIHLRRQPILWCC
eukprot:GHVU01210781.1.p1 GENE.GHVU01210781.1~~GHVU01210781.1.p1  ORF type:complete len:196 (-),score=17.40 GHVU01210781.1:217-804(-)